MADKFFEYIWSGWLCLASPVLSNTGTDRGLPISCFGIDVADSIHDIGTKNLEMMLLAKHGGGVGIGINQIRPASAKIKGNGTSDGVVPFCKIYDSQLYLPLIKDLSDEELHRLILTLNTPILKSGSKYVNLKETLTVNRSTSTSALWSAISLCEELKQEIEKLENVGENLLQKRKATGEPYVLI